MAVHPYLKDFVRGRRFVVIKDGARISGMKPSGPYVQSGFSLPLHRGDILTCAGESMTMGDGVYAVKWLDAAGKYICNDAIFSPYVGGMWGGLRPDPAYLVPEFSDADDVTGPRMDDLARIQALPPTAEHAYTIDVAGERACPTYVYGGSMGEICPTCGFMPPDLMSAEELKRRTITTGEAYLGSSGAP
jgi:hypothetical protein